MERLNAFLIAKIEALHADCVGARPDDDGDAAGACQTALTAVYWALAALVGLGDAAIVVAALYFGVGYWSIWAAIALGCASALGFYALTGAVRRRIDAF